MKIVITCSTDSDYQRREVMVIDEKERLSVGPCEPEDDIIGRDLVSCQDVAGFMKAAYNAGKAGEEFAIEVKEATDE